MPASLTNDNVLTMNGGGAGLQKRNFDILERAGAAFHYETAATELLEDRTGRVTGVRARYLGPGWDSVHVRGDSLNRYRYPYGILVNMKSERFIDEVYDTRGRTYASMGRAIMAQHDRLCELNVIEQVTHVCETSIVSDAWVRDQPLAVHSFIYGIQDGILHDLKTTVRHRDEITTQYAAAISALGGHAAG